MGRASDSRGTGVAFETPRLFVCEFKFKNVPVLKELPFAKVIAFAVRNSVPGSAIGA